MPVPSALVTVPSALVAEDGVTEEDRTTEVEHRAPPGEAAEDGEDGPAACRRAAFVSAALDEVLPALKALEAAPSLYSALSQCVASAVAAAGCALVFWQASWYDGSLAAACGGARGLRRAGEPGGLRRTELAHRTPHRIRPQSAA